MPDWSGPGRKSAIVAMRSSMRSGFIFWTSSRMPREVSSWKTPFTVPLPSIAKVSRSSSGIFSEVDLHALDLLDQLGGAVEHGQGLAIR